jgi:hypothetical protein
MAKKRKCSFERINPYFFYHNIDVSKSFFLEAVKKLKIIKFTPAAIIIIIKHFSVIFYRKIPAMIHVRP